MSQVDRVYCSGCGDLLLPSILQKYGGYCPTCYREQYGEEEPKELYGTEIHLIFATGPDYVFPVDEDTFHSTKQMQAAIVEECEKHNINHETVIDWKKGKDIYVEQ